DADQRVRPGMRPDVVAPRGRERLDGNGPVAGGELRGPVSFAVSARFEICGEPRANPGGARLPVAFQAVEGETHDELETDGARSGISGQPEPESPASPAEGDRFSRPDRDPMEEDLEALPARNLGNEVQISGGNAARSQEDVLLRAGGGKERRQAGRVV